MRFRDVRIVGLTASFQMHQSARESGRYSLSTAAAPAASVGGSAREREQSPARAGESRPRRARESGPRRTRVSGPRRARELSPPNARGTRSGAGWPSGPPSGSGAGGPSPDACCGRPSGCARLDSGGVEGVGSGREAPVCGGAVRCSGGVSTARLSWSSRGSAGSRVE